MRELVSYIPETFQVCQLLFFQGLLRRLKSFGSLLVRLSFLEGILVHTTQLVYRQANIFAVHASFEQQLHVKSIEAK